MAPSTMKKGPMAINLSEMSHAVDVVPTLAPRTTPKLERKCQDSRIDQRNGKGNDRAAGLNNRSGDCAKQYPADRTTGEATHPSPQLFASDLLDLAAERLEPV